MSRPAERMPTNADAHRTTVRSVAATASASLRCGADEFAVVAAAVTSEERACRVECEIGPG